MNLSEKLRHKGYQLGNWMLSSETGKAMLFFLRKAGVVRVIHAILDFMEFRKPTRKMLHYRKMAAEKQSQIMEVMENLSDERSRYVYENILKYRCTKDRRYLRKNIDRNIYFNEYTNLGNEEIFVDAGAFDGDTIKLFLDKCNGNYRRIYAFEPEAENVNKIRRFAKKRKISNLQVFSAGLWEKKTKLFFTDDKGMNFHVAEGENVSVCGHTGVDVEALDNLKLGEITFLKMDIEGAELKALKGARESIRQYRPKLAISIYHKPEDYYAIPNYIKSIVNNYCFYVRHHTCFDADTVFYAIPAEDVEEI